MFGAVPEMRAALAQRAMCLMRAALAECAVPELRAALEDVVQNA
jgi:hypothetical protein